MLKNVLFVSLSIFAQSYLTVQTRNPFYHGEIKLNETVIGWGYSPAFSYGKDRIAYLDTAYNIIVTDLNQFDTIETLAYRQWRPTLSWDSVGNIYYCQRLSIVRIDTATKQKTTVYTFSDSSWFNEYCYEVNRGRCAEAYPWQLIEGNVVNGKYASFTVHRGDNAFNTVWYVDIQNNITKRIFTSSPYCQAALSFDAKKVYGMPFGHRVINYCYFDSSLCSTLTLKPLIGNHAQHFWTTRTFKFALNHVSFYDSGNNTCCIYNELLDTIIFKDTAYYIYDYIPYNDKVVTERIKNAGSRFNSNLDVTYDIRGRQHRGKPLHRGVYFQKTVRGYKRFVIL